MLELELKVELKQKLGMYVTRFGVSQQYIIMTSSKT